MRYFFHVGYRGSNYCGWQRQPHHLTVQEVFETTIGKVLKEDITILGCGRTDSGVHASQYFFHLDTKKMGDTDMAFVLNKILPEDIAVFDVIPVAENVHAQFDARVRTYDYFIHTYKDPFLSSVSSFYLLDKMDIHAMKKAVALLTRYNDYRAFCKSPDQYLHATCTISFAKLFSDTTGDKLRFQISSNRFLKGMIRAIVARLLKVGTGELSVDEFESYLISKKTLPNLEFAYPQGLFLSKVSYPYLDLEPRREFLPEWS